MNHTLLIILISSSIVIFLIVISLLITNSNTKSNTQPTTNSNNNNNNNKPNIPPSVTTSNISGPCPFENKPCNPACDTSFQTCFNGVCSPDTKPADIPWEGWASTTQFGSGNGNWPDGVSPSLNLCNKILGRQTLTGVGANTMGAAIPWNFVCGSYSNRTDWLNAIVNSANGIPNPETKELDNVCYMIQPVQLYPNEMTGIFCQTGETCADINSSEVAATYGGNQTYPEYLIIPYEGCGGDCSYDGGKTHKDCGNSCSNIQGIVGTCKQDTSNPNTYCDVINTMAENNWDPTKYMDTIDKINYYGVGISEATGYGKTAGAAAANTKGVLNWCTGQNMHFDIAQTNPLWENLGMGNIATTTGNSNIIVRYKKVPCNIYGNFDPSTIQVAYAGGSQGGTNCYNSKGQPNNSLSGCPDDATYCGSNSKDCACGERILSCCPYGTVFKPADGTLDSFGKWSTDGYCYNETKNCKVDTNGNCLPSS
jgi:hypothetical protein